MTNTVLTEKDIKTLIKAYVEYKKVEARFKELKASLCENLATGKYLSDKGYVNKSQFKRSFFNVDKLLGAHPELEDEISNFYDEKEITSVSIVNLS